MEDSQLLCRALTSSRSHDDLTQAGSTSRLKTRLYLQSEIVSYALRIEHF
jgi:hypothetical protein